MAGLKGFMDWFDLRYQPSLTGVIMACGAMGALTTSVPVTLALPVLGWRGIFMVSGGLAIAVAIITWWVVPERSGQVVKSGWADSLAGVARVFRARSFWRFAPQSAMFTGCFMALQGLWVVPWLMNVNHYSRELAAMHLLSMSIGMLVGQLGIAALLARFHGKVSPYQVMQVGLAMMLVCEAFSVMGLGSTMVLWTLWSVASAAGSQMYGVVARQFPPELAGRATTAINLMAFVGAFALQWGLGGAVDALRAAGAGTVEAYRTSFAAMLIVQVAAYAWMLRREKTGPSGG